MIINSLKIDSDNFDFNELINDASPNDKILYYTIRHTIDEESFKNDVKNVLFLLRGSSVYLKVQLEVEFNGSRFIPVVEIYRCNMHEECNELLSRKEASKTKRGIITTSH